jgi:katanin p60 ATPase-containing subunit A1
MMLKRAFDYEKEAQKLSSISSLEKMYMAKRIYVELIKKEDSKFRKNTAYQHYIKAQEKSFEMAIGSRVYEREKNNSNVDWISNCIIKPLFGFEEVYGLDDVKKVLINHYKIKDNELKLKRKPNLLLYGPPGCGKTHIIKAFSKEIEPVEIYNIKLGSILSKYYGESSKIISSLFSSIKNKDSILYIDEIDSIGSSRDNMDSSSLRVLNTFLSEIDGVNESKIKLIGSTNRFDKIDEAFLSRFEYRLEIPKPNKKTKIEILKNEISKNIEGDVDVDYSKVVSCISNEFSGREIRSLVLNAYSNAINGGRKVLKTEDFIK